MSYAKKLKGEVSVSVMVRLLFHLAAPGMAQALGVRVQKPDNFNYFIRVCR